MQGPLKRAYETACILRGSRELPVVVDERIKEIGFGALEGADFTKIRGDKTSRFTAFFDAPECYEAPEGGEPFSRSAIGQKIFSGRSLQSTRRMNEL